MKKLPIGIQSFRKIIDGGYVYVDKTQYVYDLINGDSYYFLSRPRRFGKSLLLDTIAEAFSGDRELFMGLYLYDSDWGFEKHPVLRFDMSNIANKTPEVLEESLVAKLKSHIDEEGLNIPYKIPSDIFKFLITALHKKYNQRVVVLIDEYDKPILDNLADMAVAEANRAVLRGFYGVLKSMDPHLRMTFLTGVTKFTKTSVFSGLNNLSDITMMEKYADICGIPAESLGIHFKEHIDALSGNKSFKRYDSLHDEILAWYDGYSWDGETRVVNPFSLLNFFNREKFGSFWYESGSPKFLIDLIKTQPETYANLRETRITEELLDSADLKRLAPGALLFQTGYLTVKEIVDDEDDYCYMLRIPNREVERAFDLHVLSGFTESGDERAWNARMDMRAALRAGDLQKMLEMLRGLFATIPYELIVKREAYYHSIFLAVMNVLGFDVQAEVSVSGGRIDATLELGDRVYVMEFKYKDCDPNADDGTKRKLLDEALSAGIAQIKAKGYADKYAGSGKKVCLAAFAFVGKDDIEMRAEEC